MAKPKSNKVYKVTCAATGASYTVRPAVWEKRLARFNTDSETLAQNYIGRSALTMIKEADNPKAMFKELQVRNNIASREILPAIWNVYVSAQPDKDVAEITQVVPDVVVSNSETIETIEA